MVHVNSLLVCVDYREPIWELPIAVAPGVTRGLIGWQTSPSPVDAGLPPAVASLLASALTEHALLSFPEIEGRRTVFVNARGAEVARRAFDSEYFDWSRRAQVIFLSPREAPPPSLSDVHLRLSQDAQSMHELSGAGVTGLLLPGVDGDVAGLYTFNDDLWNESIAALRMACQGAGVEWRSVTETEFAELLAHE